MVFNKDLTKHIADATNVEASKSNDSQVTEDDVMRYVTMIVRCCAERTENFTSYLRSPARLARKEGLTLRKYETMAKHITVNVVDAFNMLNTGLKVVSLRLEELLLLMKPLVISKAGPNIRFLWIENPRMRAYAGIRGGFALACTGRVVCYHVFPDMVVPHLTPSQIMDSVDAIWPLNMPKISMTADSYFTSLGWMEKSSSTASDFCYL